MHLIDANVLITAKNQYYEFERVPEFWDWLAHMGANGAIKMPLEIMEEVLGGEDDLAKWLSDAAIRDALCLNEEVNLGLVQKCNEPIRPRSQRRRDDCSRSRPVLNRLWTGGSQQASDCYNRGVQADLPEGEQAYS